MEQVAKLKRTWNLSLVLQIIQKNPEKNCLCLYLSNGQVCWLSCDSKIYSKTYFVSCTNAHDTTDLVNHGMVKSTRTWISWERNITFLRNKKNVNLCFRWHISRGYCFVAEVTFQGELTKILKSFSPNISCLLSSENSYIVRGF